MSFTPNGVKLNNLNRENFIFKILFKIAEAVLSVLFIVSLAGPMIFPNNVQAAAGVSKILSYQGRLTDSAGALVADGTRCFRFSIYDAISGGTKLWPSGAPLSSTSTVLSGVFNVGVGDTSVGGDSLSSYVFSGNDTQYLNVEVYTIVGSSCTGGSFETLAPRQRIDAVAYARVAEEVYGPAIKTSSTQVQIGSGTGSASPILLNLDWKNTSDTIGGTCSPNGAIWYNSNVATKTALVCNNGLINAFGSGATSSIYAVKEQSTTTPIINGTVNFSGSNNITISQTGNTLQFSGPTFSNSNNVSFGTNAGTITASVNPGVSNLSAGTSAFAGGQVIFSNLNGVSFGMNAGTITASVAAGGGGLAAIGNTASSNAFTSGSIMFSGLANMTVNTSVNGVSQYIQLSAPNPGGGAAISAAGSSQNAGTVVFSNANNVSFGMNGSTITATVTVAGGGAAVPLNFYQNISGTRDMNGFAFTGSHRSLFVFPLNNFQGFPGDITANTAYLNLSQSGSTATMSAAFTSNFYIGVYTLNTVNSSLALLNSVNASFAQNPANTNNSTAFVGPRFFPFYSSQWSSQPVFKQGSQYYLGWFWSSAGVLNQTNSIFGFSQYSTAQRSNMINTSGTATSQGWAPFYGVYTATTNALPTAINNSQLTKVNAAAPFVPHVIFNASAVTNF